MTKEKEMPYEYHHIFVMPFKNFTVLNKFFVGIWHAVLHNIDVLWRSNSSNNIFALFIPNIRFAIMIKEDNNKKLSNNTYGIIKYQQENEDLIIY